MRIIEFTAESLRFLDALPEAAPPDGFVWAFLDRVDFQRHVPELQAAAQRLGGSALLDLHVQDLASDAVSSHYDATSVYDIVVFRRLATAEEVRQDAERETTETAAGTEPARSARRQALHSAMPEAFARINSRPVGFAVFDRLLISVHPSGCFTANVFVQRFVADVKVGLDAASVRSRLPGNPSDLALRMINVMVDSYLDLRKELTGYLDETQGHLLRAEPDLAAWNRLLDARRQLNLLEDLCEEQQDAMQEWIDTLREMPLLSYGPDPVAAQTRRDALVARARDVVEHITRVLQHARRLEQSAETAVQIHFSVQGHRTNAIMRMLTAITAIFLPLNLFTGFFGMNFEHLPLIHSVEGMWTAMGLMAALALVLVVLFMRRRYLNRNE